ncbi:long-chain-acyl-CoA synthetase [Denitratisoma sp. DHT3]|uniref:long-chain-acyl-CoA synthetase n=1 Tax=Denitratisoma sp. DHT3 TaxID=1981880 RepID=UPI001198C253|nr:long-chain-acyl-CoA synthetase [Denitratisoma sp. DHT3]QDX80170.1 long-chain-acyl-CoA synthetase [Denitratisoma sp. DHT3]
MVVSRDETQVKLDRRNAVAGRHKPRQTYTMADRFEECAADSGERIFIHYGDHHWTYGEVNAIANRYARALQGLGLKYGDACAMAVENRPEFFFLLWALAKLGVTASLINTNITGKALAHCLSITSAKAAIVGEECLVHFHCPEVQGTLPLWLLPDAEKPADPALRQTCGADVSALAEGQPDDNLAPSVRDGLLAEQPFVHIYTSGTTGLPKAVLNSHMRVLTTGDVMQVTTDLGPGDVCYCFLPLYHGAALMSLTSTALSARAALMLRRKFSLREFWSDVRKYKVTFAQYVGEICRYLLNQPETPADRDHTLRKVMGAGLNAEVWERFATRFGIEDIYEGWGATESNGNIQNVDNFKGSIGRIPYWEKTNIRLVRYDVETESHPRDANGHMILCQPGETGEIVAFIVNHPDIGGGRFEGYTSPEATEKKILRNVFQDGDAYFSSGDLARYDDEGYFYFVDRIGDTFRWKSENVSTSEVADAFASYPGLEILTVYGVKVPDHEGRAGMAAVVMAPGRDFDPKAFYDMAAANLPGYAVPYFVRVSPQADMTSTFKLRRVDLQRQGYDPSQFTDPLLVRDDQAKTYVPYSESALAALGMKPFVAS